MADASDVGGCGLSWAYGHVCRLLKACRLRAPVWICWAGGGNRRATEKRPRLQRGLAARRPTPLQAWRLCPTRPQPSRPKQTRRTIADTQQPTHTANNKPDSPADDKAAGHAAARPPHPTAARSRKTMRAVRPRPLCPDGTAGRGTWGVGAPRGMESSGQRAPLPTSAPAAAARKGWW